MTPAQQLPGRAPLRLQLFITGGTRRSTNAVANLQLFCTKYLEGRYELEIIDLYRHPERAHDARVVALPLLIRLLPEPRRLGIGDLSDTAALKSLLLVHDDD